MLCWCERWSGEKERRCVDCVRMRRNIFVFLFFSLFERRLFIFSNILLTAIAALPDLLLGRRIASVQSQEKEKEREAAEARA